ncbi:MAG: alpha/beta hydrolase-fold protein [Chitinophagaceae bacterium]
MHLNNQRGIKREVVDIDSKLLQRSVKVECFLPTSVKNLSSLDLLLINDGQDMEEMGFGIMLEELISGNKIVPLLCVAIHAGDRIMEYGTAAELDYLGRGYNAGLYTRFIFRELLPFIKSHLKIGSFNEKSFAGFSLGGLSALDIVWNHPHEFTKVGVFSGSFWWRSKNTDEGYVEDTDRIMHAHIRKGHYAPGLKFFFQAGTLDETMDRNNNGIIDSIDDTLGVIDELIKKGYAISKDITYLQIHEGRHDVATWSKAMPEFLKWGWGIGCEV